jgi:O-antigen ligase
MSHPQFSSQDLFKFGLIIFAIFSPFSIAGAQIGLGLAILGWISKFFERKNFFWKSSFWDKPILIYLGTVSLSIIFSYNVKQSLVSFVDEWLLLVFFLLVNNLDEQKFSRKLLDIIIFISVIVAFYAIYQHYTGQVFFHHRPMEEYRLPGTNKFRSLGNFSIPLTYGFYAMVVSLTSFCLAAFESNSKKRNLYYLASLFILTGNLFSYTRGTQLAQIFGFIIFFIFSQGKNKRNELILVLSYFIFIYFVDPDIFLRFKPLVTTKLSEADLRTIVWSTSLRIFLDHQIFGIGFGNFNYFYEKYLTVNSQIFGHAHNDFLNVAVNAGIFGFLAFLWMWAFCWLNLKRNYQKSVDQNAKPILLAGLVVVSAYWLASQFQCFYTDAIGNMILFFIIGTSVAADKYLDSARTIRKL